MQYWLGIDVASRAAYQASLADGSGRFLWSGHRFRSGAGDPDAGRGDGFSVWQDDPIRGPV